uniref:Ribosomal protein L33 n=1 Tax=Romanomermis culicivorax TaxID=13658 RepID=A0A915HG91_ROMCU
MMVNRIGGIQHQVTKQCMPNNEFKMTVAINHKRCQTELTTRIRLEK